MNIALETYSDYIVKQSDKFLIPVGVLNKLPELDSQILESDVRLKTFLLATLCTLSKVLSLRKSLNSLVTL